MTDFIANKIYTDSRLAMGMERNKSSKIAAAANFHPMRKLQSPPPFYIVISSIPAKRESIIVITEKSVIN